MSVSPHLAGGRLTVDLAALVANWRELDRLSRPGRASAVVKANAYGLGVERVVPALWGAGCREFFVALADEGVAVKRLVPDAEVFILNGIHADNVAVIAEASCIPVLSSHAQIDLWAAHNRQRGRRLPCALQVDTGMNRLGLTPQEAIAFAARNTREAIVPLIHVMSHFACADSIDHPLNRRQIESFQAVAAAFADIDSSLSNSAGTLTLGACGHPVTRPGIALYGGEAVNDLVNPMKPVITLEGRIVQIRHVAKGDTISYGATHVASRGSRIATVSVGYADGFPRAGSGSGVPLRDVNAAGACGYIGGKRVPLVGRVTMDLTMYDVTDVAEEALSDGWIEFIGPNIPLDDVARAAGTIGYEILTGLGSRYHRRFIGET